MNQVWCACSWYAHMLMQIIVHTSSVYTSALHDIRRCSYVARGGHGRAYALPSLTFALPQKPSWLFFLFPIEIVYTRGSFITYLMLFTHLNWLNHDFEYPWRYYHLHTRGVGTGPADPATAGLKFSVHQAERSQLINISYTLIARIKQLWNFIL